MPLAYYSRAATAEFWREHWGGHSVEELLRIARASPLTDLIARYLAPAGRVLEAGCGVGQYVILLRERGHAAVGADWSFEAVREAARSGAPVSVMDLRALGVRNRSVVTYLSLGVVEHDPSGPGEIVAEAARVMAPGGVLLLSVPYWNGIRRLFTPYLLWQNRRARAGGGQFYQFAFTRREVQAFIEAHGFTVRSFHPYDPARILKKAVKRVRSGAALTRPSAPRAASSDPAGRDAGRGAGERPRALRRLLYTPPALRLFGHMILVVATRR